jgi:putative IMPACT (imprinted ancient) family translation regulator
MIAAWRAQFKEHCGRRRGRRPERRGGLTRWRRSDDTQLIVKVLRAAEFSLTVERSRFYALLTPLAAPGAMDDVVKARRRDYRKARHHCWAYRLRDAAGTLAEVSKNDGEVGQPGRVLLELLRKHDLEGALVVSRIFGGVKLGVGGVSRAFRDAGQGAVATLLGGTG